MGKASKQASEIDIVAIENKENNLILGDCKYIRKKEKFGIIVYVTRKTPALVFLMQAENVQYIIFNMAGLKKGYEMKQRKSEFNLSGKFIKETFFSKII